MLVAAIGVVINGATALLFMKGRERDLNIRGAFLHMAADAGVSAGVIVAGFAINVTGIQWIDPMVSLLIVLVIAIGTWGLLRDSINLSLAAVPAGIDAIEVEKFLVALPGVTKVHDLHIWAMSTTETALTAHLVKPDAQIDDKMLARICEELHARLGFVGFVCVSFCFFFFFCLDFGCFLFLVFCVLFAVGYIFVFLFFGLFVIAVLVVLFFLFLPSCLIFSSCF
jgi:cobalt-zinc-cadmium efflux system protein